MLHTIYVVFSTSLYGNNKTAVVYSVLVAEQIVATAFPFLLDPTADGLQGHSNEYAERCAIYVVHVLAPKTASVGTKHTFKVIFFYFLC